MLPPPLPCLPSALCSLPSSAKMPDPSPPPFWLDQLTQPSEDQGILRVEIRCSCHIDLWDAQFAIQHNEQTNDFFVELISPQDRLSAPVLSILFRFLPSQPEHVQIFLSSYGHWRRFGSVQRCPLEDEPLRLHVRVHQSFYSVELNGKEVERLEHRQQFGQLLMAAASCCGEEKGSEKAATTTSNSPPRFCTCPTNNE